MIFKNVASQGVYLSAFDTVSQAPKTGDAANITAAISKDGAASAATATTHPTEIGGGIYWLPLSQAETNANAFALLFASTTSGVQIDPIVVFTTGGAIPSAVAGAANGLPTLDGSTHLLVYSVNQPVTAGTVSDKTGYALAANQDVNVSLWGGAAVGGMPNSGKVAVSLAAADVTGNLKADLDTIKARAVADPGGSVTIPIAIPTAVQNADALLSRNVSNVESAAPRTSLVTSILAITNKANTADHAGYLTVYRTDGVTEHVRIPIAANANAMPIEGIG